VTTGLGFAGVGHLGEALIRELPRFPGLRLAGVQDRDPALAAAVGERHGAALQTTDYEALIASPGVDAVVICTPNALHVPQARAALRAGKDVLVQKPLALSPADARETVELARALERLLVVDYSYRFLETTRLIAELLPSIGPVQAASAVFHNIYGPGKGWFFDPALSGGGALIDLGVHLLDLALSLLAPSTVALERTNLSCGQGHAVEDAAELALHLDGVPFELSVSWNARRPATEIGLTLLGERGTLRWENVAGSFYRFRTLRDGTPLLERETALRDDTLRAFADAVTRWQAPPVELRVYEIIAQAYAADGAGTRATGA
jgi:predicted dehydrogenase